MKFSRFAACAGLAVAAVAVAGPVTEEGVKSAKPTTNGPLPPRPEVMAFFDNFDSYPTGSQLVPQGGWQFWGGAAPNATLVSSPTAFSAPNSVEYNSGQNDLVYQHGFSGGKFYLRCMTYMPTGSTGDAYVILMNTYAGGGAGAKWSLQTVFSGSLGTVDNDAASFTLAPQATIVRDTWVEYGAVIDLTNDLYFDHYNGAMLSNQWIQNAPNPPLPLRWTVNALNAPTSPGQALIDVVDLYSAGNQGFLVDDYTLTCYADCDVSTGVGNLDIFDFLCFQNSFASSHPYACECDTSTGTGVCDIFDFLCYQNQFALGCP